jgi:hypothetical protein
VRSCVNSFAVAAALVGVVGCGGSDAECRTWRDCGVTPGDAVCEGGACRTLGGAGATGRIDLTVSVDRRSPLRGQVHSLDLYVFQPLGADGREIDCARLMAGADPRDPALNVVRNLSTDLGNPAGTLFPGIGIEEVPAAGDRVVFVRGFTEADLAGTAGGAGCQAPVQVRPGGTTAVTVELQAP